MNVKELLESGLIELYCLGISSEEETRTVEMLAKEHPEVRSEISSVNNALAAYALAASKTTPPSYLKDKILQAVLESEEISNSERLPPELSASSTIDEWLSYLEEIHVKEPETSDPVIMLELPGTEDYYSYAVFAKPGGIVDEEVHHEHSEYLFICSGTCEMTIGGKKSIHEKGDYIAIAPGVPHSAIVTGSEKMLVIGQRRAA